MTGGGELQPASLPLVSPHAYTGSRGKGTEGGGQVVGEAEDVGGRNWRYRHGGWDGRVGMRGKG